MAQTLQSQPAGAQGQTLNGTCAFSMVSAMVKAPLRTVLPSLALAALVGLTTGCGADSSTDGTITVSQDAILNVVPGDPGWQPVTPPDESICIGVTPGPEAWALSRAIAEAAALAATEADVIEDVADPTNREEVFAESDATTESDTTVSPGFNFPPLPDPEPDPEPEPPSEDDELTDPCVPDYEAPADCIGVEAPAFAAYDFQPQSCGYGATYGLDVFRGTVTFVALLASW